jgi:hypothetical protein
VAEAVEFVALRKVGESFADARALEVRVDIAVRFLHGTDQAYRLVDEGVEFARVAAGGLPADRLKGLEQVGVGEQRTAERCIVLAGQATEVV